MGAVLSPVVSKSETEDQAVSHDRWFRAKVQASLSDPRPATPHDQVMAHMDAIIEAAEKRQQSEKGCK
ncbi:stability determinant [Bordetella genomosp. 13]|uniref:type II toxin-antitoxin system RelB family antitoxin n=1 Tax=Bordetella genomosp. 13 TaxID=463040 RepID=UPI0011A0C1E1|nr:stability determinant [Bordetella genomosp. 13]